MYGSSTPRNRTGARHTHAHTHTTYTLPHTHTQCHQHVQRKPPTRKKHRRPLRNNKQGHGVVPVAIAVVYPALFLPTGRPPEVGRIRRRIQQGTERHSPLSAHCVDLQIPRVWQQVHPERPLVAAARCKMNKRFSRSIYSKGSRDLPHKYVKQFW